MSVSDLGMTMFFTNLADDVQISHGQNEDAILFLRQKNDESSMQKVLRKLAGYQARLVEPLFVFWGDIV